MPHSLRFAGTPELRDLDTFVSRAAVLANDAVRLVADGRVLAAFVLILGPRGFNDETPTVLGMRAFELVGDAHFDIVVPIASLRDRLAAVVESEGPAAFELPHEVPSLQWQVGMPPRDGWSAAQSVADSDLIRASAEGVAEIKKLIPTDAEEYFVRRVRSAVWGANLSTEIALPAGVAFAATTLGFLGDGEAQVSLRGPWTRLITTRGNIVAKSYSFD